MLDYIRAHRKVLLGFLGLLLIQVVDNDTADWIILAVDTILVGAVPNDQAAVARIYPNRG